MEPTAQKRAALMPEAVSRTRQRMLRHNIQVFADYFQFYIWDRDVSTIAPENYTDDDVLRRLKVAPNVVVIQPIRNTIVPVQVDLHDVDPGFEPTEWDHIVECSLDLPTGGLQIGECTGEPVLDLDIRPGSYRVRALFAGLETLSENGLEGTITIGLCSGSAHPFP